LHAYKGRALPIIRHPCESGGLGGLRVRASPLDLRFRGGDVEVWVMADIDGTTFLTGANAGFIAELYTRFLEDPRSVDESWRRFFSEMNDDVSAVLTEARGPSWAKRKPPGLGNGATSTAGIDEESLRRATTDSIRAL